MAFVLTERLGAVVDDLAGVAHRHGFRIPRRITIFINDPNNLCDRAFPTPLPHEAIGGINEQPFLSAHVCLSLKWTQATSLIFWISYAPFRHR
jgi:hypothetical protein